MKQSRLDHLAQREQLLDALKIPRFRAPGEDACISRIRTKGGLHKLEGSKAGATGRQRRDDDRANNLRANFRMRRHFENAISMDGGRTNRKGRGHERRFNANWRQKEDLTKGFGSWSRAGSTDPFPV